MIKAAPVIGMEFRRSTLLSGHHRHLCRCKASESSLLDRDWMLPTPDTKIHKISLTKKPELQQISSIFPFSFSNNCQPTLGADGMWKRDEGLSFYVVRDDLLHPLVNGNKARKLDAVLPVLQQYSATDVVTCGGCQSAHTAAVAVSCAERGIRSHLLLRGEHPEISTGYNLISLMYGSTTYVPRTVYANRSDMLSKHASFLAGNIGSVMWLDDIPQKTNNDCRSEKGSVMPQSSPKIGVPFDEIERGSKKVVIINEGAGDAIGLLGLIRLVAYLSQNHLFGREEPINLVIDAGTGTTAVGLALGAMFLGLPWKVSAVMLADTIERYMVREKQLISNFRRVQHSEYFKHVSGGVDEGIVHWVERIHPRKFGKVLEGEIKLCQQVAQETGILLDPVYTLAAWEHAVHLSLAEAGDIAKVVILHTGGTLGMFGLAQRYIPHFRTAN